jgi:hypothetical protein
MHIIYIGKRLGKKMNADRGSVGKREENNRYDDVD